MGRILKEIKNLELITSWSNKITIKTKELGEELVNLPVIVGGKIFCHSMNLTHNCSIYMLELPIEIDISKYELNEIDTRLISPLLKSNKSLLSLKDGDLYLNDELVLNEKSYIRKAESGRSTISKINGFSKFIGFKNSYDFLIRYPFKNYKDITEELKTYDFKSNYTYSIDMFNSTLPFSMQMIKGKLSENDRLLVSGIYLEKKKIKVIDFLYFNYKSNIKLHHYYMMI